MKLAPSTRALAVELLLASEARFRARAAALPNDAREQLASALRDYSTEIITLDHSKGVALAELADLVTPARAAPQSTAERRTS